MANPVPVSYSAPAGKRLAAGRLIYPHALLDLIAAAPEGGWVQLNNNEFRDAWPLDTYLPDVGPRSMSWKIMGAWSSVGWDSKRHKFYLFGGGHANTGESTLYEFDAVTGLWGVAYYSPDVTPVSGAAAAYQVAGGGALAGPVSCHTYSNNNYLPVLDRFYHPGGALFNTGGGHRVYNPDGTLNRTLSGYLCQLPLAGKGFVSTANGANPPKVGSVPLPGAKSWEPLDYQSIGVTAPLSFVNTASDVVIENGIDVVYQMHRVGTSKSLTRIKMPTPNIADHVIEPLGVTWSFGVNSDASGALDRDKGVFVLVGAVFGFWDIKPGRLTDRMQEPVFDSSAALTQLQTEALSVRGSYGTVGMAADPIRGGVVIWGHGKRVYKVTPPAGEPTPTTGWTLSYLHDGSGVEPGPLTYDDHVANNEATNGTIVSGPLGKWRYASDLDCFIGAAGWRAGKVWLWKPIDWIDPRAA